MNTQETGKKPATIKDYLIVQPEAVEEARAAVVPDLEDSGPFANQYFEYLGEQSEPHHNHR